MAEKDGRLLHEDKARHAQDKILEKKRQRGLSICNVSAAVLSYCATKESMVMDNSRNLNEPEITTYEDVLPFRYVRGLTLSSKLLGIHQRSFLVKGRALDGQPPWDVDKSLYHTRVLYTDEECVPLKVALLMQASKPYQRAPIQYTCIAEALLVQTNALLCQFLWPGINIKECLSYPDGTVVALYKKLVVGVGLMTPSGYITYMLVHPEWRRAGIASVMLSHLIKTARSSPAPTDVTLHVSVSNPAMILYQKFGFKAEEFIVNFYDKYIAPDQGNAESKNALLLRLKAI